LPAGLSGHRQNQTGGSPIAVRCAQLPADYFFFGAELPPAGESFVALLIGLAPLELLRTPGVSSADPFPDLAESPVVPDCFHSETDQTDCVSMTKRANSSMSSLNDSVVMFSLSITRSRMNRRVVGM